MIRLKKIKIKTKRKRKRKNKIRYVKKHVRGSCLRSGAMRLLKLPSVD